MNISKSEAHLQKIERTSGPSVVDFCFTPSLLLGYLCCKLGCVTNGKQFRIVELNEIWQG